MPVALSDGDVRGILDFLFEAGEVEGADALTEPVVAALRRLIPTDGGGVCNVFGGLDPRSSPERRTVLDFAEVSCEWCTDLGLYWNDDFDDACRLFVARDEVIPPRRPSLFRPTRQSDLVSYREQRANELWWYVGRHFGDDAVWLWLPAPDEGVVRRISFGAEKRGGVTERDVRVLELLTPHLVQLYRRAAARRALPPSANGLTPREYEVMALARDGRSNKEIAAVLWVAPSTVKKHLEHIYDKLGVTNRTAAVARLNGTNGASSDANGQVLQH